MVFKRLLFASTFLIIGFQGFAQGINEFRVYYGSSDAKMLRNEDLDGAGANEIKDFNEFGIRYSRSISKDFSLETGINYLTAEVKFRGINPAIPVNRNYFEELEIISIPLFVNYTFLKYFFVNAGPMVDFQLSENNTDSQSGIGYSLGIGGKLYFNNFLIFINPNFKRHSVIPFKKENHHQKLTEFGVQVGVGYRF